MFASKAAINDLGNLWVEEFRRPGGDQRRWTVSDSDGVMLGTLTMPTEFRLLSAGEDLVLGMWRDDLDVEHVQMYELIKSEG